MDESNKIKYILQELEKTLEINMTTEFDTTALIIYKKFIEPLRLLNKIEEEKDWLSKQIEL